MKLKTPPPKLSALFAIVVFASLAAGQELVSRNVSVANPQQGQLRQIRVQTMEDGSVKIEGPSGLRDAVSYQSADRYVVIVPQAFMASFQTDQSGKDFLSMRFEQRGDDVEISFKLRHGATARLVFGSTALSVLFTPPQVAMLRMNDGAAANQSPVANPPKSPPSNTVPAAGNSSVPATAVPQIGIPSLKDLLAQIPSLIPGATKDLKADFSNIDLSVPESPAFTVLGITPNTIVRPATPRALGTSLLNGLDKNGNFQSGLAIDTAPYMLFNGQNVTLQDYNDYYLTRLLSRTQFSFATTKAAASDDTSTRLALGLNLTLWDKGDARVYHPQRGKDGDVLTCFKANIQPPDAPSSATPSASEIAAINARAIAANSRVADACRDKVMKANWNATSWTVAYAPSWITKNGQNSDLKWNGGALWTSFAYGFDGLPSLSKIGQLILHARYRTKEQVVDPNHAGQFLEQDSTLFGGRFRAGNPNFAFNVEGSYVHQRVAGNKTLNSGQFAFGAEMRVSENLYLVVTGGNGPGDAGATRKGFFMSSFKYGFNKKSQLNPQP